MASRLKASRALSRAGRRHAAAWILGSLVGALACCAWAADAEQKIRFDLSRLDKNGLVGHGDGLRSLTYEFCIPAKSPAHLETVLSVNPGVQCSSQPRGRIGCEEDELLCLGDTHDQGLPALRELAALEFIAEIRETYFE